MPFLLWTRLFPTSVMMMMIACRFHWHVVSLPTTDSLQPLPKGKEGCCIFSSACRDAPSVENLTDQVTTLYFSLFYTQFKAS